ncbi:MAG: BamA/TamA family outer membrane protein [Bacteroidota bacterium]
MREVSQLEFLSKKGALTIALISVLTSLVGQDSTRNQSSLAVFPAISFAPETSLQFGAAAVWVLPQKRKPADDEFLRQSTLAPFFLYTLKNQIISAVNFNFFFENGGVLDGSVRYFDFPDLYFGIGNDTDKNRSESYTNRFFRSNGLLLHSINKSLFAGINWDFQYNTVSSIAEGGMLLLDSPVGIDGGLHLGLGPALRFDTRDNAIYPSKGYFFSASGLLTYLGDFRYTGYFLDLRKYLPLWNDANILALQLNGSFTSGGRIPFYKLPQLGGDSRLRGIANASLYRARQMVYAQAEYRRPLFWRLGMTIFAGIGEVAQSFSEFQATEFKYVAGVGGRFAAIPKDKLNLRVDLGVARGGQFAIYASISEAF